MTSLAEEREEQQRWTRLLARPAPVYDRLLENEFEPHDRHRERIEKVLGGLLRFASGEVPHYREAFRRAKTDTVGRDPTALLAALPVLTKLDVQDAGRALRAERLPSGEEVAGWSQSSGTTGRPTRVLHTKRSFRRFDLLVQRGWRWHRLDPTGKFGEMRLPSRLPNKVDGREIDSGETLRRPTWPNVANFATGPYVGISTHTPVEERIEWLRREGPDYLMAYSETLELLALAAGDERPAESLKAVIAISEQVTPSMRRYIERRFETPVHQDYGLTEIGLVATRCDSGRYHAHREHCFVEILDEKGRACEPGETGRIVVTGLSNLAMPLIRYDTGDLALAADGLCPCNRTLPSFGEIAGRYSRVAFLPGGTIERVLALRTAIETMPAALVRDLREFEIHQYADRRIELRLVARATLPDAFFASIRADWARLSDAGGPELAIVSVEHISRPGGKAEVFTSDFMPARDEVATPAAGETSAVMGNKRF
jgi:phenylacetate-CoA ligase